MNRPDPSVVVPVFMAVWIALGIGSACFFLGSRNARLKREVFPWFVIFVGVLFASFVVIAVGDLTVLAFVGPAVALISFLNIRGTRFCDACGATLFNHAWFNRMNFCSKCGAKLDQADGEQDSAGA